MATRTHVTEVRRKLRLKNAGKKRKNQNANKGTTPSLDKILGPFVEEKK